MNARAHARTHTHTGEKKFDGFHWSEKKTRENLRKNQPHSNRDACIHTQPCVACVGVLAVYVWCYQHATLSTFVSFSCRLTCCACMPAALEHKRCPRGECLSELAALGCASLHGQLTASPWLMKFLARAEQKLHLRPD